MKQFFISACGLALTLALLPRTQIMAADLNTGDKAPEFQAKADNGETWNSQDHIGQKVVVVYFYPADFTGGCTKQACGFRDDMSKLTDKGVEVVGVSGDTAETHALFKKAHELNYTLLADPEGKIAEKFGVPTSAGGTVKATVDGKEHSLTRGVTEKRWTFVIDKQGRVAYKDTNVNAAEDSRKILKEIAKVK